MLLDAKNYEGGKCEIGGDYITSLFYAHFQASSYHTP